MKKIIDVKEMTKLDKERIDLNQKGQNQWTRLAKTVEIIKKTYTV